ncbi:MAG: T9SS type A sorting domain-containing protein, partial [Chlorobi bacterium]|nr:T9SS type A sorting domain-containing protein [Chlorobiota bacterium]
QSIEYISAELCDAHVEGLTGSLLEYFMGDSFSPRLIIAPAKDEYAVVKSDYPDITKGDVLLSVDGMSIEDWEEKLSHYLSSGNPDVFRRDFARRILHGDSSTVIEIEYRDSLDEIKTFSAQRIEQYGEWYYDYYVNDSLKNTKWKKWDCNVGYVNMGILYTDDVYPMYNDLYQTKAIIFDVRNYPNGTISNIGSILFDQKTEFVRFTFPDMTYPGTFSWSGTNEIGRDGNPVSYMGKVIILCNANTQSHAEYTIMGLQAFPGAIVIGSPTAGADGNITRFYISKDIQAGYTSIGVFYPNGDPTQRIGIAIDSLIYPTAEGIRQGRDEVLEKALEIAGCEPICVEYENIAKSEQSIYPNPALDFIHTRGVNEECLISDLIGKVLWKGSVNESGRIPISNLDRGIYFFKTQSNSIMFIKI